MCTFHHLKKIEFKLVEGYVKHGYRQNWYVWKNSYHIRQCCYLSPSYQIQIYSSSWYKHHPHIVHNFPSYRTLHLSKNKKVRIITKNRNPNTINKPENGPLIALYAATQHVGWKTNEKSAYPKTWNIININASTFRCCVPSQRSSPALQRVLWVIASNINTTAIITSVILYYTV